SRPGTPAASRDEVPEEVKTSRLHLLQERLSQHQAEFQAAMVGRTLPVLLEKPGRLPGQMVGRSPYLQPVHMLADAQEAGRIVQARIIRTDRNSLAAERILAAAE
ncbi:MAG: TRAM domain-containing protein, partial [Pseudomonadota bacterium]